MKRPAHIKRSGPYVAVSRSDGTITLYPRWSQYPDGKPYWLRRSDEDEARAGGPGFMTRLSLAADIEALLNVGTPECDMVQLAAEAAMYRSGRERT